MSLTPLLAIALQTVRKAVRSWLAITLLVLAGIIVWVMPMMLRDDGSLEGRFRVMLVYTLNGSFTLIVMAALWAACAAVSEDIASRRLHLVMVKPVSATTLWCGQWLGLTGLHGILLLLVWMATLGHLHRNFNAGPTPDGSSPLDGRGGLVAPTARLILADPAPDQPGSAITDPHGHLVLPPGRVRTVRFRLPRIPPPEQTATLEFQFASSQPWQDGEVLPAPIIFHIGGPTTASQVFDGQRFNPNRRHVIENLSLAALQGHWLYVAIENPATDPPVTLMLNLRDGLRLRVPESGWRRNHLRAGLILMARLGFFTAAGLTAGTLFSFPVAAFIGGFLLFFASMGGYIRSVLSMGVLIMPHEGPIGDPTLMDRLLLPVFGLFDIALQPLSRLQPIRMLGAHELITATDVALSFGVLWPGYVGLLAVAGILTLRHREIGIA